MHPDSDDDFGDADDGLFDDVQREKTPSAAAAVIVSELDKRYPGFLSRFDKFKGDTLEEKMQNAFFAARQLEIKMNQLQQDVPGTLASGSNNAFDARGMIRLSGYQSLKSEKLDPIKDAVESLILDRTLSGRELSKGMGKLDPSSVKVAQNSVGSTKSGPYLTVDKLAAAFYIADILENEQKTPAEIAKDYLDSNGIKYKKFDQNRTISAVFDEIDVPLSSHSPAKMSYITSGIEKLSQFFDRTIRDSKYVTGTKVSFAGTPEEFADKFFALHPDQVGKISLEEITSGTVGFNVESGDGSGNREIVLNLEALEKKRDKSYFGGNAMEETVAHEYAHSVEKAISPNWGQDNDPATEEYRSIFESDPDVSPYSSKNISEHFAESFAKYVVADEASPEFIEYLKSKGIEKPDLSKLMHPMMADDVEQKLNALVNSNEDSPVTFKINLGTPSSNERRILERIRVSGNNNIDLSNHRGMSLTLIPKDPSIKFDSNGAGRGNGSLEVDRNGKLSVSGDLLSFAAGNQGQGIGSEFLKNISKFIAFNGGGRINMTAGLDNGPYMWAISGFKFAALRYVETYIDLAKQTVPFVELWRKSQGKLNALTTDQKYGFYLTMSEILRLDRQNRIDSISDPDLKAIAVDFYNGTNYNNRDTALTFLEHGLENGWDLSEEDYQNLMQLGYSAPRIDIMPMQFANIGRKGKAETAFGLRDRSEKRSSSFGRRFMLAGGMWKGYLDIPDMRKGAN